MNLHTSSESNKHFTALGGEMEVRRIGNRTRIHSSPFFMVLPSSSYQLWHLAGPFPNWTVILQKKKQLLAEGEVHVVSAEEHKVGKECTRPREGAWPPPHGNGKLLDGLYLQHARLQLFRPAGSTGSSRHTAALLMNLGRVHQKRNHVTQERGNCWTSADWETSPGEERISQGKLLQRLFYHLSWGENKKEAKGGIPS